ncbi:hypothetical protein BT96DRAFT_426382 [Gymnopus androsaceus JB14]|uniref:Uncharacterized protein n=1 Tax=Gymnopus androsaceus JB14 TaxID=1447944 RepID=A0A6A4I0U7_9AGAR|nr:hypothetical protein BT96DRAFT_426382 [Gymnopus androsaceus JB14]
MSIGTGTSPFSLSRRLSSNTPNSITTENQNDLRGEGLNQRIPFIQNMFRKKTRTFSNTSKNTGISIRARLNIAHWTAPLLKSPLGLPRTLHQTVQADFSKACPCTSCQWKQLRISNRQLSTCIKLKWMRD